MIEKVDTEGMRPEQAVAASCVHVIAELSRMVQEGFKHDDKSEAMVIASMAFLTSVLDGKMAYPEDIGKNFDDACRAIDGALLDEVSRCQHFLADALEEKRMAEGRATVAETYERWYLRLRDGDAGLDLGLWEHGGMEKIIGEDLDIWMEDLDAKQFIGDPANDIDLP